MLGAQYQASAKALQEQNAAVVAGYRSQTAASRAEVAAAQERAARIREQQAQMRLTSQLAAQARREEEQRYAASINALNNEQRAYRNLWQSRQLSDDQVIEAQRRIHTQALLQAQAVDKQSDAYRRLTQVAAAAQRTMDSAQGINTPGGFSSGTAYWVVNVSGTTFELAASFGGTPLNSSSTGSGTVTSPASQINSSQMLVGVECNATNLAFQPKIGRAHV